MHCIAYTLPSQNCMHAVLDLLLCQCVVRYSYASCICVLYYHTPTMHDAWEKDRQTTEGERSRGVKVKWVYPSHTHTARDNTPLLAFGTSKLVVYRWDNPFAKSAPDYYTLFVCCCKSNIHRSIRQGRHWHMYIWYGSVVVLEEWGGIDPSSIIIHTGLLAAAPSPVDDPCLHCVCVYFIPLGDPDLISFIHIYAVLAWLSQRYGALWGIMP